MFKLNCKRCDKCIYRVSKFDNVCDNCYLPDGTECDLDSKPENTVNQINQDIIEDLNNLAGKINLKATSGLPEAKNKIFDQNGKISGLVYDSTSLCLSEAINYASKTGTDKRARFRIYLEEIKRQIDEQIKAFT